MGKSTVGPEWLDCARYLAVLQDHHEVTVSLLIGAGTGYGGLPLSIDAVAAPRRPEDPWNEEGWHAGRQWPNLAHKTIEGAVYRALMDLDELLAGTRWKQEELGA